MVRRFICSDSILVGGGRLFGFVGAVEPVEEDPDNTGFPAPGDCCEIGVKLVSSCNPDEEEKAPFCAPMVASLHKFKRTYNRRTRMGDSGKHVFASEAYCSCDSSS